MVNDENSDLVPLMNSDQSFVESVCLCLVGPRCGFIEKEVRGPKGKCTGDLEPPLKSVRERASEPVCVRVKTELV